MIRFELPFNFNYDKQYFNLLDERQQFFQRIDSIYMPTFEHNGLTNTRINLINYPESETEYHNYIIEFHNIFYLKI